MNARQCRHARVLWWSHRSWISKNSMKLKRFTAGINSVIMAAADKVTMLLAGSEALATKGKLQLVMVKKWVRERQNLQKVPGLQSPEDSKSCSSFNTGPSANTRKRAVCRFSHFMRRDCYLQGASHPWHCIPDHSQTA